MDIFEGNGLGHASASSEESGAINIVLEDSADVPGHRGDEGLLEGVVIKDTDDVAIESDDEDVS